VIEETPALEDPAFALADAIRSAVLAVPGVLALSPGVGFVEATYGRNRAIYGVGLQREPGCIGVNVHVVVAEEPIPHLAQHLRRAVYARVQTECGLPAEPINLWIDDMHLGVYAPSPPERP